MGMIDQIRASKLPSNMMQFAARGALQVGPAENIEILVYLARHNKIFGDLARMTLAGWDEKACLAAVSDPQTPREVLEYFVSFDNLRPKLLPALVENPSVPESELAKLAISVLPDNLATMLKSARVRSSSGVVEALRANPHLKKEEAEELRKLSASGASAAGAELAGAGFAEPATDAAAADSSADSGDDIPDEAVSAYLTEHAAEIAAEGENCAVSI